MNLQDRLRTVGYWLGDDDGGYGPLAEQAVMAFL
jgi:peptidoglycan hydrolase-like protein with peptidoglycan-binding domain